jgi:hypothetical protein
VVAAIVVIADEGLDLGFQIGRQSMLRPPGLLYSVDKTPPSVARSERFLRRI